jgi:hypothetical protein
MSLFQPIPEAPTALTLQLGTFHSEFKGIFRPCSDETGTEFGAGLILHQIHWRVPAIGFGRCPGAEYQQVTQDGTCPFRGTNPAKKC